MVEDAERSAYGPLGLRPWELARLTPADLEKLLAGWRWRDRRERELMAWAVCTIANACGWLKQPLRYEDLLAALLGEQVVPRAMGAGRKRKKG